MGGVGKGYPLPTGKRFGERLCATTYFFKNRIIRNVAWGIGNKKRERRGFPEEGAPFPQPTGDRFGERQELPTGSRSEPRPNTDFNAFLASQYASRLDVTHIGDRVCRHTCRGASSPLQSLSTPLVNIRSDVQGKISAFPAEELAGSSVFYIDSSHYVAP